MDRLPGTGALTLDLLVGTIAPMSAQTDPPYGESPQCQGARVCSMGAVVSGVATLGAMVVVCSLLLTTAGCERGPARQTEARVELAPPAHVRVQGPEIDRSRLVVNVPHLPTSLNPLLRGASSWCHRITMHLVFETLLRRGPDGKHLPALAERMDRLDGGKRLLITLRDDVSFHDGRPLGAADVVFTLRQVLTRNFIDPAFKLDLTDVREVVQRGPHQVEVRLRRLNALLPSVLADLPILPAHRYRRVGLRNARANRFPVGTGPYLVRPESGEGKLLLSRYGGYWGPEPAVDRIDWKVAADPQLALSALRNGEADILADLHPAYYPDQVDTERFRRRFRLHRMHPYRLRVLLFNTRQRPLKDRRVRLAVARLLDRPKLVRAMRRQLGQVLSGPLWSLGSWYDRTLRPLSRDPQQAERLLDAAGWSAVSRGRGLRRRLGHPMRLRILHSRDPEARRVATEVAESLRGAKIGATTAEAGFAFVVAQLKRGRFDLAVVSLRLRAGGDLSPYFHSKGQLNYGGYANPSVDAALDALKRMPADVDRIRIGRRLHQALYHDPPVLTLYASSEMMVFDGRLVGVTDDGRWPDLSALSWP